MENIENQIKGKGGRKPLFHDGKLDYRQEVAAILLGVGWGSKEVAKKVGISPTGLGEWKLHKVFQDMVVYYRQRFIKKQEEIITAETINIEQELTEVVQDSKAAPIRRSDGVQALKELGRRRGQLAPKEIKKTIEYKEGEKLSDKELNQELNEFFKTNEGRETSNIRPRKKEGDR